MPCDEHPPAGGGDGEQEDPGAGSHAGSSGHGGAASDDGAAETDLAAAPASGSRQTGVDSRQGSVQLQGLVAMDQSGDHSHAAAGNAGSHGPGESSAVAAAPGASPVSLPGFVLGVGGVGNGATAASGGSQERTPEMAVAATADSGAAHAASGANLEAALKPQAPQRAVAEAALQGGQAPSGVAELDSARARALHAGVSVGAEAVSLVGAAAPVAVAGGDAGMLMHVPWCLSAGWPAVAQAAAQLKASLPPLAPLLADGHSGAAPTRAVMRRVLHLPDLAPSRC